jgi:hypothetical protein
MPIFAARFYRRLTEAAAAVLPSARTNCNFSPHAPMLGQDMNARLVRSRLVFFAAAAHRAEPYVPAERPQAAASPAVAPQRGFGVAARTSTFHRRYGGPTFRRKG